MKLVCNTCGESFHRNRQRLYCSRSCSNKRVLSEETRKKLRSRCNYKKAHEALRRQRIQNKQRWTDQAKEEFDNYQHDPLFIFGVALYWAEGFKTGGALGLTNSDPEMIKVWLKWHHKYFSGLKVRGKISAHDDVKEKEAIDFWSGLGIKDIKLYRANPSSSRGKSPGRLPHGTLQVITKKGSLEAFTKMMVWIDMISNTFI